MPEILTGQQTHDSYQASTEAGCAFPPDKNTQQVIFSGQGGDYYAKVYIKTGGTHAGVWDGVERLYLDGSGDAYNSNCAGVEFRSATPGTPVSMYGSQAFPGDVISAAPAFGGGPSGPFSVGLDVTDGVTNVFPTTEIFIGPGLTLTMLAAGVAELQGSSSLEVTDGVTTVNPATELLISTGLVLTQPSPGVAEVASLGITVGPWYYATPVAPAAAPSGGIASSAFQNSVVNAQQPDGSYDPLRWRLVGESVEFAGTIGNVIPGSLILTLPLAFRPVYDTEASIVSADGTSSFSVGVSTSGAVTMLAVTGTGSGSTPGGPASGDLSGSYPDPVVSNINGSPLGSTGGASMGQVLTWNGSAWGPTTIGGVSSFNGRTGAVTPANTDYLAVAAGGLAGATAGARLVGGTASGHPTTGTFAAGDLAVDQTGTIWVCTAGGTPGTWVAPAAGTGLPSGGAASQVVGYGGSPGTGSWVYPPGYEFDYAQITAPVTITATSDGNGNAQAVIDGNPVTYDGATRIKIEFNAPFAAYDEASGNQNLLINVYDGTNDLGRICNIAAVSTAFAAEESVSGYRFLTPSAATHTYHIRSWKTQSGGTATIGAGPGGASAYVPAWYRIIKA